MQVINRRKCRQSSAGFFSPIAHEKLLLLLLQITAQNGKTMGYPDAKCKANLAK
jgi:hypothetical protein